MTEPSQSSTSPLASGEVKKADDAPNKHNYATTTPSSSVKTDQSDRFDLKVKAEFVLDRRPGSLGKLPLDEMSKDDRDNNNNKNSKRNKKKKRPRDKRMATSEKVCLAVLRGDECPYGETCKFSHDLKEFLKTRPDDIVSEISSKGCPNFNETGFCMFGAMCRFGGCHLIKSTGENIRKEISDNDDGDSKVPKATIIQNNMPREILMQLRKNTYSFKTESNVRKNRKGSDRNNNKTNPNQKGNENRRSVDESKEAKNEKETSTGTASVVKEDERLKNYEGRIGNAAVVGSEKPILDPFRPKMTEQDQVNTSSNPTPMPTKTKKIIDFSNKVYVAPLTTVGNLPFRRIMKHFGADITCGEMAVAGNLLEGKPSEWALLKRHPSEDIFGVQIASGYPDQFTRVAEVIENHLDVDFVDMNLGCPLDIICNRGAGASLMLREKNLKGILTGITKTLSCPVTIKMRTGWDMSKPFAHKLVPTIQSWGIDGIGAIMIHGRSRLQRYQKLADWDYIGRAAKSQEVGLKTIPVIGNGDIFSYTDYDEKTSRDGLSSAAMLGRGALIKPWLPTEIKERRHWDISATERLDILKDFVRYGLTHWGSDQQGVDNTRRFLLEWLSFLHRYVPVGLLERVPQEMNQRPPPYIMGRNDLETLFLSPHCLDWVKISEMLLGPVPEGFRFEPKHKASSYNKQ